MLESILDNKISINKTDPILFTETTFAKKKDLSRQSEQLQMTQWTRENILMTGVMIVMMTTLLSFLLYYSYKQKSEVNIFGAFEFLTT